jgi:uncharacterized protein (DUF1501 family)
MIQRDYGLRAVYLQHDGWDLHAAAEQPGRALLADLAESLDAFAADLGSDLDRVIVVTLTEFGRQLAENGSAGTDHGSGSEMLLLGGGVRGGRIFGDWPGLAPDRLDSGGVRVTTDHRLVLAEVLQKRCGADPEQIFPGLRGDPLDVVRAC